MNTNSVALIGLVLTAAAGCAPPTTAQRIPPATAATSPIAFRAWAGIYASPSEIGGFSGTVLELMARSDNACRMLTYTDMRNANDIEQDEQ
jgi:hypothetical protein